ncbi:MAG: prepilin-type cleavage/methylation domain-containing protein [Planctomycetes bacterium]|nr:prepilin-type cleavage/methylation domain-containing protein [Planctomycetota bacterium]
MEVVLVMTILGVLVALSMPSYGRAVEQSRAEIAAANLRAIWSAQRLYWLEHRTYATTLTDLSPLLDPALTLATSPYTYAISVADATTFTATATRTGSTQWSGELTIDQAGTVTGALHAVGETDIVPSSQ